ncbi:MAG: hypothetical protein ACLR8U_09180 [Oscillospiraceae bacterium]
MVRKRRRGRHGDGALGAKARFISVLSNVRSQKRSLAMLRACQKNELPDRRRRSVAEPMELIGALFCEVNSHPGQKGAGTGGLPGRACHGFR